MLDSCGQQKWTGYHTEWDCGESQYLKIVLKGRVGTIFLTTGALLHLYHRVADPLEGTLSLHMQLAPLCEALTSREGPKDPPIWQDHGEDFRLGLIFLPGICGGVKHYSKFCCCLLGCQYLVMRNVVFQGVCTIFIWDDFYNSLLHLVLDYGIIFLEMFVITWRSIEMGSQPSHCQFIIGW